jgi:hypothetical protein
MLSFLFLCCRSLAYTIPFRPAIVINAELDRKSSYSMIREYSNQTIPKTDCYTWIYCFRALWFLSDETLHITVYMKRITTGILIEFMPLLIDDPVPVVRRGTRMKEQATKSFFTSLESESWSLKCIRTRVQWTCASYDAIQRRNKNRETLLGSGWCISKSTMSDRERES